MQKTILIVDDEPKNLKLIRDVLEVFGYSTISASNGRQAVESAVEKKPDLILMDLKLPVLDGKGAIEIILQTPETSHIPVIALTGWGEEDPVFLKEIGFRGLIKKPFDIMELKAKVEEYIKLR
jgi:two-component system cell cycle response regulator DivK